MLEHVELHGILEIDQSFAKVDEIPFDFSRRRMSVVVSHGQDKHVLICKGAVEEIFAVCTRYEIDGTTGRLDDSHFATAKEETVALNSDGFRVVAVAYKELDAAKTTYSRGGRKRPDLARLHRLSRPAEGERAARRSPPSPRRACRSRF